MTHPWDSDCELNEEIVRELIAGQFPEVALESVRYLNEGWDSRAFSIDERWIFRFPKRASIEQELRVEMALLPRIAPRLPLPIPLFRFIGRGTERYPYTFVGYQRIEGRSGLEVAPESVDFESVGERIGAFLGALHGIPIGEARACGVARVNDSRDLETMRTSASEKFEAIRSRLEPAIAERCERVLNEPGIPPMTSDITLVLLHNDLSPEHILLDGDPSRPCGVIDWGDVAIGDPAVDFAGLYQWGGEALVENAMRYYRRPIDGGLLDRARFRGLCVAIFDLYFGYESGRMEYSKSGAHVLMTRT